VTLREAERKEHGETKTDAQPAKLNVLVIDDDPIALEHAQIVLKQVGVHCDAASSGKDGIEKVRLEHTQGNSYDLILVDWRMPDIDGVETTKQIRSIVGGDIPIIILTSYNWDEIAGVAKAAGVDTFVSKPLFAENVLDEFGEAINRKKESLTADSEALKGLRILLAEDVPINAEIMVMVHSMKGMTVDIAENGKIAVDMFKERGESYYDAILMDLRMPVMDGLEATAAIRGTGTDYAKEIPVIALTAKAFDEDVQHSMKAGLNAHLSKPVNPDILFETLENLINKHQ